jgi:NitT/TauT family transport system substrate-binding protein
MVRAKYGTDQGRRAMAIRNGLTIAIVAAALSMHAAAMHEALAADKVSVGTVGNNSDAGFLIAAARGYFVQENLDVALVPFDAAAKMIVPLGTGDLDVGGGAASVGLYNAAANGVTIKIVADRSRTGAHYNFQALLVRKDLVASGAFKTYADLKGKKVAIPALGGSPISTLNEAAKKGGIAYADIEKIYLAFPQQIPAFANGAIDASIMVEPFATAVAKAGTAVRIASTEDFYPSDQIGMVFYAESFIAKRHDVAERFMVAYVQALRDYNDVVSDGRFATDAAGDAMVKILSDALKLPPAQIREAETQAIDPDGRVNEASLRKDLAFMKEIGEVTAKDVTVDQLIDNSFVTAAVAKLGPTKSSRPGHARRAKREYFSPRRSRRTRR